MDVGQDPIKTVGKIPVMQTIDTILNEAGLSTGRQVILQMNTVCFLVFSSYHSVLSYFTGASHYVNRMIRMKMTFLVLIVALL